MYHTKLWAMRRYYKLRSLIFSATMIVGIVVLLGMSLSSKDWSLFKRDKSLVFNSLEDDQEEREAREAEWYIRHARPYIPREDIQNLLFDGIGRAQPKLFDEELLAELPESLHDRVEEILREIPLHQQRKLIESFPRPGEPNGNIIKLYPPDGF